MDNLRLNCGSGQRRFEGWINIDTIATEGRMPDLKCDIRHLPFDDATVEMACLHHVIEHFGCGEADDAIKEAWRVLKPGGSLFVFVPDLHVLAQRWLAGMIDDYLFMVNTYGAYMKGEPESRHQWGYTQASLLKYLTGVVGWSSVRPFNWRHVEGMDAARDWWVATAECVK